MANKKIKLTENRKAKGLETPRFIISYLGLSEVERRNFSRHVILNLVNESKVLLKLSSFLMQAGARLRKEVVIEFAQKVKEMGYEYRYRNDRDQKGAPSGLAALFSLFSKNSETHEINVMIDRKALEDRLFFELIPIYGAEYDILYEDTDTKDYLDKVFNGQFIGDEVNKTIKIKVFDCSSFGSMALYTDQLEYETVKKIVDEF